MDGNFPQSQARQPFFNAPKAVIAVIAALIAAHFFATDQIVADYAFVPATPDPWRFVSHAFLHGDWMHLAFNAIWLLVFGTAVTRRMGAVKFLLIAAVSAAAGAAATGALHGGETLYLLGASGAVSGLLAAAVPVMYGDGMRSGRAFRDDLSGVRALRPMELLTKRPALIFLAIWLGLTMISAATGLLVPGEARNIAWEAHIGGFAGGLISFYLLDRPAS